MSSDTVRLIAVAAVLVGLLAGAVLLGQWRESGRPELLEARVVTATAADPVLRDGLRRLAPREEFAVAVALRVSARGHGEYWLAPGPGLVLGGTAVDHVEAAAWPDEDRQLRVFWSTLESDRLGGNLPPREDEPALTYRSFLVPEMGRALRAEGLLEAHHDDFLAGGGIPNPGGAGTLRFYARVEVVREPSDVRAEQSATSLGVDDLWDPRLATVQRLTGDELPVAPAAGELLLLPGYQPHAGAAAHAPTLAGRTASLEELVAARLVTTSRALAALAVGSADDMAALQELGEVRVAPDRLTLRGRPLPWGEAVRPRDLLAAGEHWMVLLGDDGDGVLGLEDPVLHSWYRPGRVQSLGEALGQAPPRLTLLRHGGG